MPSKISSIRATKETKRRLKKYADAVESHSEDESINLLLDFYETYMKEINKTNAEYEAKKGG